MLSYRCKCGESRAYGSMPPEPCHECPICHTTLETHPDLHRRALDHDWHTAYVQTDEGMKPVTTCRWCGRHKD